MSENSQGTGTSYDLNLEAGLDNHTTNAVGISPISIWILIVAKLDILLKMDIFHCNEYL